MRTYLSFAPTQRHIGFGRGVGRPRRFHAKAKAAPSSSDNANSDGAEASPRPVARRVFDFAWPLAALYLANAQAPVGDVEVQKSEEEWQEQLSPMAFHVLRERGTERAGSSELNTEYSDGTFSCAGCGEPLFSSSTKFDSGTGWPSFYQALPGSVDLTLQLLYCLGDFGAREVRCHSCGGHLGHVFSDGPKPTGKRYCMNGVALQFSPRGPEEAHDEQ